MKFVKSFLLLVALCLLFITTGCGNSPSSYYQSPELKTNNNQSTNQENMTKVLFVVAPQNFKDEEYYTPKALLEGKGFGVDTTSVSAKAISINGVIVDVNLTLDQAESADYQAIVFVGGPGADVYFNNQTAKNLASKFHKDGKVVAAICIAPSILANAGILNGKQATAFSSEQSNLKAQGAVYTGDSVTVDGKIITGRDPSAASEFGNEIVRAMGSL